MPHHLYEVGNMLVLRGAVWNRVSYYCYAKRGVGFARFSLPFHISMTMTVYLSHRPNQQALPPQILLFWRWQRGWLDTTAMCSTGKAPPPHTGISLSLTRTDSMMDPLGLKLSSCMFQTSGFLILLLFLLYFSRFEQGSQVCC